MISKFKRDKLNLYLRMKREHINVYSSSTEKQKEEEKQKKLEQLTEIKTKVEILLDELKEFKTNISIREIFATGPEVITLVNDIEFLDELLTSKKSIKQDDLVKVNEVHERWRLKIKRNLLK